MSPDSGWHAPMKWLKWAALGTGAVMMLVIALVAYLIGTEPGTRWAAALARNALGGKLDLGAIDGTFAGPLSITDLRYRDPAAGFEVRVSHVTVDAALADLFRSLVHVHSLELHGIDIVLRPPSAPPEPEAAEPFSLRPPIDVSVDSLVVSDARVRRDEARVLELTRAACAGHWTQQDLAIERLEVRSPQGELHFTGRVGRRQAYVGEGHGRFRWTLGERTYAGVIDTIAKGSDANLSAKLSSPLRARAEVLVEQSAHWPWRFTLEVPRFDPREELMPDSSLYSLAASLHGRGSLESGTVSGSVLINDEPVLLDPLQFTRDLDRVSAQSVLRIGATAGEFRVEGQVELTAEPWSAKLAAHWRDVLIPSAWAGQELHTRGQIDFSGGTQAYRAKGALALGPPGRSADIALAIQGSPAAIELEQFDILQKNGRLGASGRIALQPAIGWNVSARAHNFDPGAFAPGWRGRIGFDLASSGHMTDAGPAATLRLAALSGELRGRPLSGNADLSLTPQLVPSGALALSSGDSELRFRGQPGERIDAMISLDIASINDWVPGSGGELKAAFVVRGRWPELSITGDARGTELNAANVRIEKLALDADLDDPRDPQGSARLDLTKLTAAGLEFETVQARASGGASAHQLSLRATGRPLALELDLDGARAQDSWSGSLRHLAFDVQDAAQLSLRQPVRIVIAKDAVEVSRACLADNAIEVCAAGALQPDGAMQASYSLANVPLALANVLASADLPFKLAGTIQGRGEVRRTPQGELLGDVLVHSPSGRISRHVAAPEGDETAEAPQTLLSYADLRISASLSGPDARASLQARFDPNGSLRGEAWLRGLGEPETAITGQVDGHIPDLAPLAVFVPQLANVHGRADARIGIAGALQAPELSGLISAVELAADVPAVGLHLKNGHLQARPARSGEIDLAGGIESGGGRLEFAGHVSPPGGVDMNINGDRVLAADIPGARVIVTPDLKLVRTTERTTLSGEITIPEAAVNLQKLPRGGQRAQSASPDVVVIDAKTRDEDVAAMPLFAEVTVNIGEQVELTGFGLQARVAGRVDVRERPGEPTVGSGEMHVAGTYKAYGQDLTIQRGQLLYAATPLENPRLNIEATREVGKITAGLRVRGSAQSPELTVFSDPPMGQANALSYLVAGKPLEDIGTDDGEADAVQNAAQSLSVAAGGLLAKNVGRRLGIDEFAVKDDELIGGAALTVGQYLSPRLLLSYGVGLFEPGDVITLRYKLSEELAVQTQRGPEDTRAGIEYRVEK